MQRCKTLTCCHAKGKTHWDTGQQSSRRINEHCANSPVIWPLVQSVACRENLLHTHKSLKLNACVFFRSLVHLRMMWLHVIPQRGILEEMEKSCSLTKKLYDLSLLVVTWFFSYLPITTSVKPGNKNGDMLTTILWLYWLTQCVICLFFLTLPPT